MQMRIGDGKVGLWLCQLAYKCRWALACSVLVQVGAVQSCCLKERKNKVAVVGMQRQTRVGDGERDKFGLGW